MTAGMGGYVINDALIKWATEAMPLFQAIFLRGLAVIGLLLVLLRLRGGAVSPAKYVQSRPLLLRVSMEAAGTVLYLVALTKLPLASLTAILQLLPVAVTFLAARLLREPLKPLRVGAVLVGFIGVLLIIRPGTDEFSPWFLAGLGAVAVLLVRELATRRIAPNFGGLAVAMGTAVAITAMGAVISIFQGWEQPPVLRLAALGLGAGALSLGYVASVNAVRIGELGFTAPFRYSVLVFAVILQIVIFRDVPDALTFAGAATIAVAGVVASRSA